METEEFLLEFLKKNQIFQEFYTRNKADIQINESDVQNILKTQESKRYSILKTVKKPKIIIPKHIQISARKKLSSDSRKNTFDYQDQIRSATPKFDKKMKTFTYDKKSQSNLKSSKYSVDNQKVLTMEDDIDIQNINILRNFEEESQIFQIQKLKNKVREKQNVFDVRLISKNFKKYNNEYKPKVLTSNKCFKFIDVDFIDIKETKKNEKKKSFDCQSF